MIDRRSGLEGQLFLEILKSSGQARLAVTGTSMLPTIWPGDILEVRRQSVAETAPGDAFSASPLSRIFNTPSATSPHPHYHGSLLHPQGMKVRRSVLIHRCRLS
jgi:hypothetical protein